MSKKDGLCREDRLRRMTSVKPFAVIDNSIQSLLERTLNFAHYIKYYNSQNIHDGYFDELLNEIKTMIGNNDSFPFNGDMEPSQALLYTFLEQLHDVTDLFNSRWSDYALWYMKDVLGVIPLATVPDKVWLSFIKDKEQLASLAKGTRFHLKIDDRIAYTYRLSENIEVQDIKLENVYSLYLKRDKNMLPAAYLNFITSIRLKDLLNNDSRQELMFGHDRNPQYAKSLGLVISSPSLLLREGSRCITLTFQPENDIWLNNLEKLITKLEFDIKQWSKEKMLFELFNEVFYVTMSVANGWKEIEEYTVRKENNNLILKFILSENFPETKECVSNIHQFTSEFPALRIYPNFDAWLYPYSWLKDFLLDKIIIETSVEDISNVHLYNELGRIDNSKPFTPFGLNTERGAWFVIGNYEMSVKNTQSIDLQIKWQQLPSDDKGLCSYYRNYGEEIDNRSFRMKTKYLVDYDWSDTSNNGLFYLFSSTKKGNFDEPLAESKLSEDSRMSDIRIERMPPLSLTEDEYEYNIKSRTGFVRFILDEPEIGFGENQYRKLFVDEMLKKALRKKEAKNLNPPLNPIIEKITLNYCSRDIIDLRKHNAEGVEVYQSYPLGYMSAFSDRENHVMPFVYNLDTDANVLFSFSNVKGGEIFTLFLDFNPISKECTRESIPNIAWYWGNGYYWHEVSSNSILLDGTSNMITSGMIKIKMPEKIDKSLLDKDGLLWLRAGIKAYEDNISELLSIHTNVGQLVLDVDEEETTDVNFAGEEKYELVPEKRSLGIKEFQQITPFYAGRDSEDNLDLQIRISEYISHRGKAVTSRDYERLVLQTFPDIAKVKCLLNYNCKAGHQGVVTIVIIPIVEECLSDSHKYKPLASSYLMIQVEEFLAKYISAYVKDVDVINPVYEDLLVRCDIAFYENYPLALCKTQLNKLFNRTIAPWQEKKEIPEFEYSVNMNKLYHDIQDLEFVKNINQLSIIKISNDDEHYKLYQYGLDKAMIAPMQHHVVFVPAKEHIIESNILSEFGINEMSVNETFIIGS